MAVSNGQGDNGESRGAEAARAGARIGSQSLGAYLGTIVGPEAGAAAGQAISEAAEAAVGTLEERAQGRVSRMLLTLRKRMASREAAGRLRATGLGETVSRLGELADLVSDTELDDITRGLMSDQRSPPG